MQEPFYKLPEDAMQDIEQYDVDVRRYLAGDLVPAVLKARRVTRGVYEQRRDGTFMTRIRVAGGTLGCRQARQLAALASEFSANQQLHVTTRQDVQMHDVRIQDTPEIMRCLHQVGLTSKGGGGNTVRNITACPFAGGCAAEPFDVTPFAHAATEYLLPLVGSYNLPRKYKVAFSGCGTDCALARASDIGFIAKVQAGQAGFEIYGGGGMGSYSRAGDLIVPWLPVADTVRAAEAGRRLFDRLGDRSNKHRARLRFVLDKIGSEAFRDLFEKELAVLRREIPECRLQPGLRQPTAVDPPPLEWVEAGGRRLRVAAQHQEDRVMIPLTLPLGFVEADDLAKIADLAERFSDEQDLRTTRSQGLLLRHIPRSSLGELAKAVQELSFNPVPESALAAFVACAGASTCRLGLCLARNAATACAEKLQLAGLKPQTIAELHVNISGCPNACGQHPIAALGFFGAALRSPDGLVPAYRVVAGGRVDRVPARLARSPGAVPARAMPDFMLAVLRLFEQNRKHDGESFIDFLERQSDSFMDELIARHSHIPKASEKADYYCDWGESEPFSLAGRGAGECGAGVFEVVQEDLTAARKALQDAPATSGAASALYQALLPTVRALLITRGVDSPDQDTILREFERCVLDSELVAPGYRELLVRARGQLHGWSDALQGRYAEVRGLLERIEYLYSTLDANLEFKLPEEAEEKPGEENDGDQATFSPATPSNEAATATPVVESGAEVVQLDLSGVACPMNFVKAKLKLETMQAGQLLEVILDDGEPIQNVPASLRNEGQNVEKSEQLPDGQWRIKVRKKA